MINLIHDQIDFLNKDMNIIYNNYGNVIKALINDMTYLNQNQKLLWFNNH